ncbi:DMT family transporter [Fulvimarina sp. 2208YS6-2-32]|uniref:DMT family transporter n=1 Tax=Fulvimarina uroteuthidis TaxID=3098149 RepID=A0ABU5I1W3_9HYPH|nr:DMT family transporter [Fulvimarina sp. 2208YS6-2-32]MDY8109354.1 DMT family transporter [Fulvimarina sp. 2208YS6-2-32]
MQTGILLAFAAYFAFACGDAATKALGDGLPIFEIGFFMSLFAFIPAAFTKPPQDRWRDVFVPSRPFLLALRVLFGVVGMMSAVVAFTTLPLAEAYALIFLLPIFVTVFSALFLKETIGWRRWSAVLVGLAGVLLVVRPGFQTILPGHFAAISCAICGAGTVIVLRIIGPTERRVTLIGAVLVGAVLANGVLMIPTFADPTPHLWLLAFGGLCVGLGQTGLVFATRLATASAVAPVQYSQIVWAAVLGALFFGEFPDAIAYAGMALIATSGLFTFIRERKKTRWWQRTPLIRNR